MARILIACEYSATIREAFRKLGHEAYSCDLLPSDIPSPYHFQCDIRGAVLNQHWDMIIFHPDCTYLTNSGVRWLFSDTNRWDKLEEAITFFKLLENHPCPKICIENPIPHKYAREGFINKNGIFIPGIGNYTQTIQPYQFGHTTSKRTCLWLKGLPELKPTLIVPKEQRTYEIHKAAPSADRWKLRSKTFQGIAEAMAAQWGNDIL